MVEWSLKITDRPLLFINGKVVEGNENVFLDGECDKGGRTGDIRDR